LSRFVGTYQSPDGISLTLVDEAGHLTLQTSLGDRFTLQPKSSWEFFFPEIPESRLTFFGKEHRMAGLEWLPRRGMPVWALKTS
jgi:hypothetical protein